MLEQIAQIPSFLLGQAAYLAGFAALLITIERLWPAVPTQGIWRNGTATDLVLSFANPLIVQPINALLVAIIITWVVSFAGPERLQGLREAVAAEPYWLQVTGALLVAEVAAYWKHRVFHMRVLWPFHAVHHSATHVDWLTNERDHPVQLLGTYLVMTTVLVLAGFSPEVIAIQSLIRRGYSLYTHANVRWSYGPLNRIFVSPAFHRWHHSSDPRMIGKNFAVMLSILDVVFGTYHLRELEQPASFGLADRDEPSGLVAVLRYPLAYPR